MGQEDASGDTRGKCVSLQALAMDGPDRIKIRFPSSSAVQFQLACFRNWVSEGRYYNFFALLEIIKESGFLMLLQCNDVQKIL